MELKLIETKESDCVDYTWAAYHKTVNTYAIGDYEICDIKRDYENGTIAYNMAIIRLCHNKYTPDIYAIYDEDDTNNIKEFKICTTSYGSLTLDEFKEFFKAQEEAMEIVEILNKKFLRKS